MFLENVLPRVGVTPDRLPNPPSWALVHINREGRILAANAAAAAVYDWPYGVHVPELTDSALFGSTAPHALVRVSTDAGGWIVAAAAGGVDGSGTLFKSTIEKKSVLIFRFEADMRVADVGGDVERMTGFAAAGVCGRTFWTDVADADDRARLANAFDGVRTSGEPASVNVRFTDPHDLLRFAELHLFRLGDTVYGVVQDRETVGFGGDLFTGELVYQSFLEQSPVGIIHLDTDGMVTFESHRFRQIVGERPEEAWIGRTPSDVPGLQPGLAARVRGLLRQGEEFADAEVIYRRPGADAEQTLRVHGAPIRRPEGDIIGGVLTVEDVTEIKRREAELRLKDTYDDARTVLREAALAFPEEGAFLHEAVPLLATRTGADWVRVLLRDVPARAFVTHTMFAAHPDDEFQLQVEGDQFAAVAKAVEASGGEAVMADLCREATGAAEVVAVPFNEDDVLAGFVCFGHSPSSRWDAVERESMQQLVGLFAALWARIRVQARYLETIGTIDDALFNYRLAPERRYTFVTPQIEALTGYAPSDIVANGSAVRWADLVYEDDRQAVAAHEAALQNGRSSWAVYRLRHRDGSLRWLRESASLREDERGYPYASGILTDVTETQEGEEALREAKRSAESANRVKTAFLATMSHEIRTPLGAINGFADMLGMELADYAARTGTALPDEVDEFVGIIRENATKLLKMVNDLFDLSNLEIGAVTVQRQPVGLRDTVQRAALAMQGPAAEKGLTVHAEIEGDPVVVGDRKRLDQMLEALCGNALKFTSEGTVSVRAYEQGEHAILEVADTGVGMTDAFQAELFKGLKQEDHRLNRKFAGTGLGLALVKRLADLMHGEVTVESERDRGSCFRVALPRYTDPTP